MTKKLLLALSVLLLGTTLSAQLNMTYKSHVSYTQDLNDIWGYAAPDDREYALVGLRNGVSIIDVTDPENPVELGIADGPSSTWRDIKTWGTFAYITNETSDGLLVIDLSNLPADLTEDDYYYWNPPANTFPGNGGIDACHNIYIDEFGYAYLAGCDANSGGMLYLDVFSDPGNPIYVGAGAAVYSHDVYVRDNVSYSSEIYEGHVALYDVTDKTNTQLINSQNTAFDFTHNAWLSDDSDVVFTTDERNNAPVGAYDISDPNNIEELDQFRPIETIGDGVIPHNVHVWNDWLIISYYTDGCIIVDGSRPGNMIEVGNFDTFIPASTGFSGAWGAYPFLPSGTVLVSDIGNGCYILEPNYVRACWLEGNVKDAQTDANINAVDVEIVSDQANQSSTNASGNYETGQATAGSFSVTFSHPGYQPLTVQAGLVNGEVTILNVELNPLPSQTMTGQVISANDGSPVPGAKVFAQGNTLEYTAIADGNGNFTFEAVLEDDYQIYAGAWGYVTTSLEETVAGGTSTLTIEVGEGYKDEFILDLGWTVEGTAEVGVWERAEPNGTVYQGNQSNPDFDINGDLGDLCYTTGNAGGNAPTDDVDNGNTLVSSPPMKLANYEEATIKFQYWFFNAGGSGTPDDELTVFVNDGNNSVEIASYNQSSSEWSEEISINLSDFITLTDDISITFETSDQVFSGVGHVVEAAIDNFSVELGDPILATLDLGKHSVELNATPNPFVENLRVDYSFTELPANASLQVFNILGQPVQSIRLNELAGSIELKDLTESGIYLLRIEADGEITEAMRVVKN